MSLSLLDLGLELDLDLGLDLDLDLSNSLMRLEVVLEELIKLSMKEVWLSGVSANDKNLSATAK